jgi:hypothetical protein
MAGIAVIGALHTPDDVAVGTGVNVGSTPGVAVGTAVGSVVGVAVGETPHSTAELAELRGAGAPTLKSAALLSVSEQPALLRNAALLFDNAPVGAVSDALAEPYPTKSTTPVCPTGLETPLAIVVSVLSSATLPLLADIGMTPVTSGAGSAGRLVFVPSACLTRRYPPGAITPASVVFCHVLPVLDAYCSDQPETSMDAALTLCSSTKSLANSAPLLPPPP